MGRQRGTVAIDEVVTKDGTKYKIYLDKETGTFSTTLENGEGVAGKDLPALKKEIILKHEEEAAGNYQLYIRLDNAGRDWRGEEGTFKLDGFEYSVIWLWKDSPKGWAAKKARFWDGKTTIFTDRQPHWKDKPSGPKDQVMQERGYAGVHEHDLLVPYTWERWQALVEVEEKLDWLRGQLTNLFLRPDLDKLLDGKGLLQSVALLPPGQEEKK